MWFKIFNSALTFTFSNGKWGCLHIKWTSDKNQATKASKDISCTVTLCVNTRQVRLSDCFSYIHTYIHTYIHSFIQSVHKEPSQRTKKENEKNTNKQTHQNICCWNYNPKLRKCNTIPLYDITLWEQNLARALCNSV